jgi:hypothetical protein
MILTRYAPLALILFTACSSGNPAAAIRFESEPRSIGSGAVGTPQFLFGSGGDIEMIAPVAGHGRSRLDAFASHDGGDTFRDLGAITLPAADVDASGENSPRFAMDRDELLYAVWRQDSPSAQVFAAVRDWRIGRYTQPMPVRDPGQPGFAGFPDIAIGSNGTAYVVWLDERNQSKSGDSSSLYFAALRGNRFSHNVRIASSACGCCRPAITVASDGTIYVAWRHDDRDLRDIAVATSRDGGRSFSPMRLVARDGWRLHGCPESGPSLLSQGRRLYIAWYTQGTDARSRVLLSHTDDGGKTFAVPTEVSHGTLDPNHPHLLAVKPSGVAIVFQARDPVTNGGWSPLKPYLVVETRSAFSRPLPIAAANAGADAEYPYAVARDADSVYVSYALGERAVLLRGRPAK